MVNMAEITTVDLPKKQRKFPFVRLISPLQFVVGIILAFLAGAIFLLIFNYNPITVYGALLQGSFGSKSAWGETIMGAVPLLLGGLAVAVGFRCGLFNMGVEGQIYLGGVVSVYIGYAWPLPTGIHLVVALAAGTLVGAIWGGIPGYLKARYKIHEVITTIMLNYVAMAISAYMIEPGGPMKEAGQLPESPKILSTAVLPNIWPGTRLSAGIIIALAVAVLVWIFLFKMRLGYKLRAVGFNSTAAEYAGISPKRMMVISMAVSGGLGGLAGAVECLGLFNRLLENFSPGWGWNSIAVSLLGLNHPLGVVVAAFILGLLESGSTSMQMIANVSKDVVSVLSAMIIFFAAINQSLRPLIERGFSQLTDRTKGANQSTIPLVGMDGSPLGDQSTGIKLSLLPFITRGLSKLVDRSKGTK
jgi:general nucleoside transport system permease protein